MLIVMKRQSLGSVSQIRVYLAVIIILLIILNYNIYSKLSKAFLKSGKKVESLVRVSVLITSRSGEKALFRFGEQTKQDVVDESHLMSSELGLDACPIFLQGHIPTIM
jgi:hypothetical protein